MSYCRFSSDAFLSDVYVYESKLGFEVHVASNRTVIDRSTLPAYDPKDLGMARHLALMKLLDGCERNPIVHEEAGAHYTFVTGHEAAGYLDLLVAAGFHVPAGVQDDLREEDTP